MLKKISKIVISMLFLALASLLKMENTWINIILYIISYLVIGFDVIKEAIENILKGKLFEENFLMSIATIGAFAIKQYPEAIAVMIFYSIGEIFEELGEKKSKNSITELMNIKPDYANVKLKDGNTLKKKPEEVKINDEIIVKPGEKIPLDGIVIDGNASIDTSSLTGESIPREVSKNDFIYSGCINLNGIITIKVTKEYKESTVSKILDLVENASEKKANAEKFITKFSKVYTPLVVSLAIAIFAFGIISKTETIYEWLYRALTFLVVSCPCALVISVPLSFFGGIGGASKKGILIKGSSYMDILAHVKTVVFDKTGTLTKGSFEVKKIIPKNVTAKKVTANKVTEQELIEYVALAENYSNHPIAVSIKKIYDKKIEKNRITDLEEISGKGIKCKIDGKNFLLGNMKLLSENNVEFEQEKETGTVLYSALEGKYIGKIIISDEIKKDSQEAIENLRKIGIEKIVMLTGDKKEEALRIAKKLNIKEVHSDLLPADKIKEVEKLIKDNNGKVAFVGDGINDSPVLARADVGIAMGGLGSDAAIEAADIVIMTDEVSKISTAIKIAKKSIRIAKQNIIFAIFIKILVLLLSMLGISNMWMAVFADVGVTLIAILNSLRCM